MYGIIIWLSEHRQSALIVVDGGRTLAFGRYQAEEPAKFAVGDLVYAKGLQAGQEKFEHGITHVVAGFWPDVRQAVQAPDRRHTCTFVQKSGNLGQIRIPLGADNLVSAPNTCCEKTCGL